MSEITFLGNKLQTVGMLPKVGEVAPNFTLAKVDLSDVNLTSFGDKVKIINIFPSIDTPVCAASVKEFNKRAVKYSDIIVLCISEDLPFASSRFCAAEGLEKVETLSSFRSTFPDDYGVRIAEGALLGLCSRAVIVLNRENKVIYSEQVAELSQQPNYEKALASIET